MKRTLLMAMPALSLTFGPGSAYAFPNPVCHCKPEHRSGLS
jgi:hypothetical protein